MRSAESQRTALRCLTLRETALRVIAQTTPQRRHGGQAVAPPALE
jgi:hypothetical protein